MGGWLNSAGAKVAVGAVAVVAVGAVGVVAYGYSTKAGFGAVSPLAGASVRSATPDISIRVSNAGHLGRYTLRVDGRDLTTASSMAGGAIRLTGAVAAHARSASIAASTYSAGLRPESCSQ